MLAIQTPARNERRDTMAAAGMIRRSAAANEALKYRWYDTWKNIVTGQHMLTSNMVFRAQLDIILVLHHLYNDGYLYIHTYTYIYTYIYIIFIAHSWALFSDFLSQEFRDFSQKGILSGDPAVNPLAHNWNRVMASWRKSELESCDQLNSHEKNGGKSMAVCICEANEPSMNV